MRKRTEELKSEVKAREQLLVNAGERLERTLHAIDKALEIRDEYREANYEFIYDQVGETIRMLENGKLSCLGDFLDMTVTCCAERYGIRLFQTALRQLQARKIALISDIERYKQELIDFNQLFIWAEAEDETYEDPHNKDNLRKLKRAAKHCGKSLDDAHKVIELAKEAARNKEREELYN